ncbi:uncharacterized protein [Petaurus breviceps papuanus]|uniref:uncharacterized protein n=1 Tax=Petaurus breviceps papuanus TaxID=3040969 RepID=UPI0036DC4BC9
MGEAEEQTGRSGRPPLASLPWLWQNASEKRGASGRHKCACSSPGPSQSRGRRGGWGCMRVRGRADVPSRDEDALPGCCPRGQGEVASEAPPAVSGRDVGLPRPAASRQAGTEEGVRPPRTRGAGGGRGALGEGPSRWPPHGGGSANSEAGSPGGSASSPSLRSPPPSTAPLASDPPRLPLGRGLAHQTPLGRPHPQGRRELRVLFPPRPPTSGCTWLCTLESGLGWGRVRVRAEEAARGRRDGTSCPRVQADSASELEPLSPRGSDFRWKRSSGETRRSALGGAREWQAEGLGSHPDAGSRQLLSAYVPGRVLGSCRWEANSAVTSGEQQLFCGYCV